MICEAEKHAAVSADRVMADDSGSAKTIVPNYNEICKVVNIDVPLRRPNRREPSREAERELYTKYKAENTQLLESLTPKGDTLINLVKKYPAPEEWYKED